MGIMRILGRTVFYGAIGAAVAFPFTYRIGYSDGMREALARETESRIERIADSTYLMTNPENQERYLLDFEEFEIHPYEGLEDRLLYDIFSREGE